MEDWKQLAGRVLLVGLPGPELDDAGAERLRALGPSGATLFRRNLVAPAQTAELLRRCRAVLPEPPLFALDQEGGRVSRLEPWIGRTPVAADLATRTTAEVTAFGAATGTLLSGLGFNVDFAPVVDLCPPAAANGIGDRSFGIDPRLVERAAGAFLYGLQSEGVAGCLKHFPGLGDTAVDSHVELPRVERPAEALWEIDVRPYRALASKAACVMVGHAHYTALEPDGPVPASCSQPVVDGWLRRRVGFDGLAVSDDLEMGAVAPRDRDGQAAFEAVAAGLDLLLYCENLDLAEAAARRLAAEAAASTAFGRRLREAAGRVDVISRLWPAPEPDLERYELGRGAIDAATA